MRVIVADDVLLTREGIVRILDTLAETYFQLGQKDQAIATIRACIDLEPTNDRHKAQLKRFEQGSPDSPPPS